MPRYRDNTAIRPYKVSTTFFCLDAETHQPICFLLASSSMTVTQITPRLLHLAARILNPAADSPPLVVADNEHYTQELFHSLAGPDPLRSLGSHAQHPRPNGFPPSHPRRKSFNRAGRDGPPPIVPFTSSNTPKGPTANWSSAPEKTPQTFHNKAFLASRYRDEVIDLALHYPQRWHVEEFFNAYQALGWKRAGTLNLNIRFGQMSLALIAQTVCHQLRQRLGASFRLLGCFPLRFRHLPRPRRRYPRSR